MQRSLKGLFFLESISLLIIFYIQGFIPLAEAFAQGGASAHKEMEIPVKSKTVIDMTIEELRREYSMELRDVAFSSGQEELNSLLENIGGKVQMFFRDFSDTSSKEEVILKRLGFADRLESSMRRTFTYLILFNPDSHQPLLEEYRTDKNYRAIAQEAISGFFITSGYSCLSVLFHPQYHKDSSFRYLGRLTSEPGAYVIAFAQKLQSGRNLVKFTDTDLGKSIRVPLQGIAWIDPVNYQILRVRTNLVSIVNSSIAMTQAADIQFGEIHFAGAPQSLWLPREVNVRMEIGGKTYNNFHRYSDYQLFNINSEMKIEMPKTSNRQKGVGPTQVAPIKSDPPN